MASSKPKTPSNVEQDEPATDSVFDFFYCDTPRIASFLAQFDNSGSLTGIVRSERAHRSSQRSTKMEAAGSILAAKGGVSSETDTSAQYGQESQRMYDPAWANARAFLDLISERSLINRDVPAAGIGQFVLSSGTLSISDLQLMHKTWQLPSVKKQMRMGIEQASSGNRKERRGKVATGANQPNIDGLELFGDMVNILPHTIQAQLMGDVEIWCSLPQTGLTSDASDITLKHGTSIPGEWSLLGILDARPDSSAGDDASLQDFGGVAEMAVKMMRVIAPIAKNLLGRPSRCYGVTPLLVFREVTGPMSGDNNER